MRNGKKLTNNNSDLGNLIVLRKRAEQKVKSLSKDILEKPDSLSPADVQQLIYELRVYQVELEMQNEELRKAQLELEKSRSRYFDLYDLAPVGYFTLDESGQIQGVNLTGAEMLGAEKSNLVKQKFNRFINDDSQDSYYLNFNELFKTREEQVFEIQLVNNDGSRFWAEIKMNILEDRESGQLMSRVVIIDITERKQYQEAFKSSLELKLKEDKIESIGLLAGGIAHDFNNYLAIMLGNISLARFYKDMDKIKEKLVNIENAILRAKELTHKLSVFSKGGAPVKKIVSINNIIKENAKFAVSGSNVRCKFSLPQESLYAAIDEAQISQVLNNIIINAVQAMPEGGTIWIAVNTITIVEGSENLKFPLSQGTYLKISIKDEGIGIPEELLEKLFDPYFSTKPKGSGLGLATSYSIIKSHDGCLTVESQEGVGTTFHILLPVSVKPETTL